DIITLAEELLARVCRRYGQKKPAIPAAGRRRLLAHRWPGNVRELAHEIERAIVLEGDEALSFAHLAAAPVDGNVARDGGILRPDFVFPESGFSMEAAIDEIVLRAVRQANDNVSGAARLLGVSRDVVRYRLKAVRPDNSSGENSPTEEG
ncbi:MAG: hypothetical protein ACKOTE_02080, partial [Opitutaceae bacterium]